MFKLYFLILCCLYFRFVYMNAFALESILMTLSRAKILLFFVKEIKNELFFILSINLLSICYFLSCFLLYSFLFVKSTVGLRNCFIMVVEIQQRLWMIARICYGISVYTVSGGNAAEL